MRGTLETLSKVLLSHDTEVWTPVSHRKSNKKLQWTKKFLKILLVITLLTIQKPSMKNVCGLTRKPLQRSVNSISHGKLDRKTHHNQSLENHQFHLSTKQYATVCEVLSNRHLTYISTQMSNIFLLFLPIYDYLLTVDHILYRGLLHNYLKKVHALTFLVIS